MASSLISGLIINHVNGKNSGLISLPFHALLDEELISVFKSRRENPPLFYKGAVSMSDVRNGDIFTHSKSFPKAPAYDLTFIRSFIH